MFVLAHISDLHLAVRPRLHELAGKRGLGFINWHRARKHIHRFETLDAITADLQASTVDHVAVTGDLVNLSLADEYRRARAWLDRLGTPVDKPISAALARRRTNGKRTVPSSPRMKSPQ